MKVPYEKKAWVVLFLYRKLLITGDRFVLGFRTTARKQAGERIVDNLTKSTTIATMTDVEADTANNAQRPGGGVQNPYVAQRMLPPHHPVNIMKRCLYMGVSLYGLHYFAVYHTIIHSPLVRHEWFKIGLAATAGTLGEADMVV